MSSLHPNSVWMSALAIMGVVAVVMIIPPVRVSSYAPRPHGPGRSRSRAVSVGTIRAIRRGIASFALLWCSRRGVYPSPFPSCSRFK
jgi:hypothetical protein